MAEYEACITRMEALRELGVKEAKVFGDSTLVIAQEQKLWKGEVQRIMELYNIEHHKSSPYRLQTNEAVEATKDWAKKLPFALWGNRTSIHASTGATPYSLVYGCEAVLPIEVEIQYLRVFMETKVLEEDWIRKI
ncbi:uncharacterized protein LOC136067083 [Quercus suber]|uniref:uncharacterized protein LOC136067083 n=1 Tax=Quercus suber TaxID=58331 RepID=UPI0032DE300B